MTTAADLERVAEARQARRQAMAGAMIAVFGDLGGALVSALIGGWNAGQLFSLGHAALALAVLVVLWRRPAASVRASVAAFLVLVLPVLPLLVVWTLAVPETRMLQPFIAQKMVLIGVALLAPGPAAFGLAVTGAIVLESVILSYLRLGGLHAGEPWVTIFYGLFAVGLLLHRASERRLAARLLRANLETAALERIARSSLEVRDRLNTPLQTLEIGVELLRRQATDDKTRTLVGRVGAAVEQLKVLSRRLAGEDER